MVYPGSPRTGWEPAVIVGSPRTGWEDPFAAADAATTTATNEVLQTKIADFAGNYDFLDAWGPYEHTVRCLVAFSDAQRFDCNPESTVPGQDLANHLVNVCGPAAFSQRIVRPGEFMTMDERPTRFTVHVNENGTCNRVQLG